MLYFHLLTSGFSNSVLLFAEDLMSSEEHLLFAKVLSWLRVVRLVPSSRSSVWRQKLRICTDTKESEDSCNGFSDRAAPFSRRVTSAISRQFSSDGDQRLLLDVYGFRSVKLFPQVLPLYSLRCDVFNADILKTCS